MHLRSTLPLTLKELVKPLHRLQERRLFGKLHFGLVGIGADGETVLDAGVEAHLVGDCHLFEQLLGLVALLLGKDLVGFCRAVLLDGSASSQWWEWDELTSSSDRQRPNHPLNLLLIHKRRMRSVPNIHTLPLRQKSRHILPPKTIPHSSNLLRALLLHILERALHNWVHTIRQMPLTLRPTFLQPLHDIEAFGAVELDRVALEEVGHDGPVAVGGELVGYELGVDEFVPDYVGEDEDCGARVFGLGVGDVG